MSREKRKINVTYKSKTIEIEWTNSLNDLKDDCQRKFPYSDYEKRIAKIFIVLPNKQELEIKDENEFKKLMEKELIKTINIKINQPSNNINNFNNYYNFNNNNNLLEKKIADLEQKYNDLLTKFNKETKQNQNKINEQEQRIAKLEKIIFESNNSNNIIFPQNEIITNPGLIGEIFFDKNKMPFISIDKILNNESIKIKIQIRNVGNIDITGTCKLVINEKENVNFEIKNPNINIMKVIKAGITIHVTLELICKNKQIIKIGKHFIKISLYSSDFGIISKWTPIYFIINEDMNNS